LENHFNKMIGYDPTLYGNKWALISLEDGMMSQKGLFLDQMADHLNASGELPEELLTKKEGE
jgi:hypothetical protein